MVISKSLNKHYHLIGIGGIGMSGIAQLLLCQGFKVSGSDLKESRITQELKAQGARIFIGHNPLNIKGADIVIYSSAITEDNSEIIEAKKKGTPLLKRAQALAQLMQDEIVITVTGSHGKTTTASLMSYLLLEAGLFPTVAVGGILRSINNNARLGNGKYFVAEADESDGSFLYYRPKYSIVTNIDYEHLDYYKEFRCELITFREFLSKTTEDGCLFCCNDDPNLKNILKDYKNRYVLFGLNDIADIHPKNIELKELTSEFDCFYKNRFVDRFHLNLGGNHNISNALSVIALSLELGIDLECIKNSLANYEGARRRLEIKFNENGLMVIDDYAHHPTEIRATLSAVKNLRKNRIIAIFQPHRYTRTKLLLDEFAKSFDLVDYVIVTDIYPANEPPIEGVNGKRIYEKMKEQAPNKIVIFLPKDEIIAHVLDIIKPDNVVITLGAGDIAKVCDELVNKLKR